jgi:pullulanase/glycogen debranching enzyme
MVVYELHVRDFSIDDATVQPEQPRQVHGLHRAGFERHEAPAALAKAA